MNTYKDWQVIDKLPEGWAVDKTAGSPLSGHVFVTNGKSPLNGQKRSLLFVGKHQVTMSPTNTTQVKKVKATSKESKSEPVIDAHYVRTVNDLARQKFKQKILNDILVDLMICEIEGWCKLEYINEIKKLVDGLGKT